MATAASLPSAFQPYVPNCELKNAAKNSDMMDLCSQIFHVNFDSVCGPQEKTIKKIQDRKNNCLIAFVEGKPVAVLVHKFFLSQKYAREGLPNSLKIKTLLMINSGTLRAISAKECSCKPIIQLELLHEVIRFAGVMLAASVHITERTPGSVENQNFSKLFQENGFTFRQEILERFSKRILSINIELISSRTTSPTRNNLGYNYREFLFLQEQQKNQTLYQQYERLRLHSEKLERLEQERTHIVQEKRRLEQQEAHLEQQEANLAQQNSLLEEKKRQLAKDRESSRVVPGHEIHRVVPFLQSDKKIDVITTAGGTGKVVVKVGTALLLEEVRWIPFVSIPAGFYFAYRRYSLHNQAIQSQEGNQREIQSESTLVLKMIAEIASGVIACWPGAGTAVSVGVDASLLAADTYADHQLQKAVAKEVLFDAYKELGLDAESNGEPTKEQVDMALRSVQASFSSRVTVLKFSNENPAYLSSLGDFIYQQRGWNSPINQCALL